MSWAQCFVDTALVRNPGARAKDVDFSDAAIDWLATMRRVNADFAAPMLWTAFDSLNARDQLPRDVSAYLAHIFDSNSHSNEQILDQCLSIGRMLHGAGLEAVLLKGAAWLFEDGPPKHDRMMRDIDLLVAPGDQQATVSALSRFGYYGTGTIAAEAGHIHDIPLIRAGEPANIEIHIEPTTRTRFLSGREMLDASHAIAPGLRMASHEHRIVHNVIHAQIVNGDYNGGVVDLRYCVDLVRLIDSANGSIDWVASAQEATTRGYRRELSGALHKAARFAGASLPAPFLHDASGQRHAARCALQRRNRLLDATLRKWGLLTRALAWDRDAYALGLTDTGPAARLAVLRRRTGRAALALRRRLTA